MCWGTDNIDNEKSQSLCRHRAYFLVGDKYNKQTFCTSECGKCCEKKLKQGRGMESATILCVGFCCFIWDSQGDLQAEIWKSKGVSHVGIWVSSIPRRVTSRDKGSKVGICLMFEEQQRGIYDFLVIIFLFLFRVNFLGRALPRVVSDFFFFLMKISSYTQK